MAELAYVPFGPVPDRAWSEMVPMRDGSRLATDVYLPSGVAGPVPTIVMRMPYDKCGEYCFLPRVADVFTAHGYAFVAQDVRGRTRSEGENFPFVHEVADGCDTVDWIVAQTWSDGAVGMTGESYFGFTAWCAAASRHPAVKAIAPRVTAAELTMATEPEGDDAGTFALSAWLPWLAYVWIDNGMYDGAEFDWSVRPLRDVFAEATRGRRSAGFNALLRHPLSDPWWTRAIYGESDPHETVDIPVLHWAGWWDNCQYGQFRSYRRMCARPEVRDRQYLIADAFDHESNTWDDSPGPPISAAAYYERDAGEVEAYSRAVLDTYRMCLPFFDRFVRELEGPPLPQVQWNLAGEGWRTSTAWPPPDAHSLEFHLTDGVAARGPQAGGGLSPRAQARAERVAWVHDPDDLVPDTVEDVWHPLGLGLPDESRMEDRTDVLTFTGKALAEPLRLAGPAALVVRCDSNAHAMHLFVKLCDVDPGGYARRILLGGATVAQPDFDGSMEVRLGDTGYLLRAGHRLRLEIASSCYPRFTWDTGGHESPWDAESGRQSTNRLTIGGADGASLRLQVIDS